MTLDDCVRVWDHVPEGIGLRTRILPHFNVEPEVDCVDVWDHVPEGIGPPTRNLPLTFMLHRVNTTVDTCETMYLRALVHPREFYHINETMYLRALVEVGKF